jgi:hypothetical protein
MEQVDLFITRLQPINIGHTLIIKSMNNPFIVIVKGKKIDRSKNPFNEDLQIKMLNKVFPCIKYSISPNGFLPGILGYLRKNNINVQSIFSGEDRINSYKLAIQTANKKMIDSEQYIVNFVKTSRISSSTLVRQSIINYDEGTFRQNTPCEIWEYWDLLKGKL